MKRNEILKTLKNDLFEFLKDNNKETKIVFESDYYLHQDNCLIVISKNSENLEKLTINCNKEQRFLSLQITLFNNNYIKNNDLENENEELVELIEEFLLTYKKFRLNLEQIDFDFNTESSKDKSFTTDFKCEITYIK